MWLLRLNHRSLQLLSLGVLSASAHTFLGGGREKPCKDIEARMLGENPDIQPKLGGSEAGQQSHERAWRPFLQTRELEVTTASTDMNCNPVRDSRSESHTETAPRLLTHRNLEIKSCS